MLKAFVRFQNWFRHQQGQAMNEYVIIAALVGLALIGALVHFRQAIITVFNDLVTGLGQR